MSMSGYNSASIYDGNKYKDGVVDMLGAENFVCVLKVDNGIWLQGRGSGRGGR